MCGAVYDNGDDDDCKLYHNKMVFIVSNEASTIMCATHPLFYVQTKYASENTRPPGLLLCSFP